MAQDLAHFFFHRPAVFGRPESQLALERVVKPANQKGCHDDVDDTEDIVDINDIQRG